MRRLTYQKAHRLSQLHNEFKAAGISPIYIGDDGGLITLDVDDAVQDSAVQAVVTAHVPEALPPPPDLKQLADDFTDAVNAATTIPQLKTAILKVRPLLKAIAAGNRGVV